MVPMKTLTLPNGITYEIIDEYARNTIERNCAPVCTETAKGPHNVANDSAVKPLQGLRVFGKTTQRTTTGKNLLKLANGSYENRGITYTANPDGSITANGTATDVSVYMLSDAFVFKAGVVYTLSGCPAGGGSNTYRIDDVNRFGDDGAGSTNSYEVDTTRQIRIRIASGTTVNNLVFRPMIRLASETDGTFEPYTGGIPAPNPEYPQEVIGTSDIKISVFGGNLLRYPYYFASEAGATSVVNGVTFTNIGHGGIKMTGTPTGYASVILTNTFMLESDIAIGLLGNFSNAVLEVNVYDENNNVLGGLTNTFGAVIRKADYPGKVRLNMSVKRGVDNVAVSGTVYPMIVAGTTIPTVYKKYVEKQTFNVSETLHGWSNRFPETYPNSYADDTNGYIADYVEFGADGSGRMYSRFWVAALTGDEEVVNYRPEDNTSTYFGFQIRSSIPSVNLALYQKCSHFIYGSATTTGYYPNVFMVHANGYIYFRTEIEGVNSVAAFKAWLAAQYAAGTPVTIVAMRNAPVITSLSNAEAKLFQELWSNHPDTTIVNDSNVWMETDYAADLKLYIQKLIGSGGGSGVALDEAEGVKF